MTGRSSQLDAVGWDVGASSSWERRVGLNMFRGGTHKRVSLGLHPVSLRKSKEMGWNGQGQRGLLPKKTAHTCKAKDKAASSLCFLRVRRYVGRWSMACPAIRPHFFGACPKKRCRAAKEKRFFYPGGSTIRVSATSRWTIRSSPDLGRELVRGGGWVRVTAVQKKNPPPIWAADFWLLFTPRACPLLLSRPRWSRRRRRLRLRRR